MKNILSYIEWRGDLSFQQDCFNEVDAAILSQLVYLNLEGIVFDLSSDRRLSIKDVYHLFLQKYDITNIKKEPARFKNDYLLLKKCVHSKRFSSLYFSKYCDEIDERYESQFSALKIDHQNFSFIAFSGTDDTFVGWKENFKMLYVDETLSHNKALYYLSQVANDCQKTLYIGGHSKGGNLAIYAAMQSAESIRNKITTIFNFDGVGVTKEQLSTPGYLSIVDKIQSYTPQFSCVGILYEHLEPLYVVSSNAKATLQHDLFTWNVVQNQFKQEKAVLPVSLIIKKGNEFLRQTISYEEKKQFVDDIFSVLEQTTADGRFKKIALFEIVKLLKGIDNLSDVNKKIVINYLKVLMEEYLKNNKKITTC